jgi:hypothetical protein
VSIKSCAWWVGLGTLLVGCAQGSTTAGSALIHPAFPYAITYDDEEKKSVLGDDWKLENYRRRFLSRARRSHRELRSSETDRR